MDPDFLEDRWHSKLVAQKSSEQRSLSMGVEREGGQEAGHFQ